MCYILNVYITYDRYEHDEWYSVYSIETNKRRAIKQCKKDLFDFISYGPDDCHSFQLQRVQMTKEEHKRLCELVNKKDYVEFDKGEEGELKKILMDIFDKCNWGDEDVIIFTDGCSDNVDLIEFYCARHGISPDDEDAIDEVENLLNNDTDLYEETLRKYISATY